MKNNICQTGIIALISCLFSINLWAGEPAAPEDTGKSEWVYYSDSGELCYKTTTRGDRIIDFSQAGYMGGGVALPAVPVKITLQPLSDPESDSTDHIQSAIDKISALSPDANGFRGAILLAPGTYTCSRSLSITTSGVVLRGSGPESIINMTGDKHVAIVVGNAPEQPVKNEPSFSPVRVTDNYIPSGSISFQVARTEGLAAGDYIQIRKPVTQKWLEFMQMHDMVRNDKPQVWIKPGTLLNVTRRIRAIEGDRIVLEVPLVDSYDATFTDNNTTVIKVAAPQKVKQVGIEHLRIVSPEQAVNHSEEKYMAIRMDGVDCWMRDLKIEETMNSVNVKGSRITLQQVHVVRKALHKGSSKPAEFAPNASQILLDRCSVEADNVWFVALGGGITGPIVLLNCHFKGNGRIEGHQRWTTGLLLDNCILPDGGIDFKNRGSMGSGHGWGLGWSVAWNCVAKNYVVQQPPGACNWAIGCRGERTILARPFDKEPKLEEGVFDSYGIPVAPRSLYLSQLNERLGIKSLRAIGY